MNPSPEDLELRTECLIEILDQIDWIISILIRLEVDNQSLIKNDDYKNIMRIMHSIKGVIGMIGFEPISKLVHQAETFFSENISDTSIHPELTLIIMKFWTEIESRLKKYSVNLLDASIYTDHLKYVEIMNCCHVFEPDFFKAWNHVYKQKKLCRNKKSSREELIQKEILIIGKECEELKTTLSQNKYNWDCIPCINSLYGKYDLNTLKAIFLFSCNMKINPFFSQLVVNKFAPHILFFYVDYDGCNFIKFIKELDQLPFSFFYISSSSSGYSKQLFKALQQAI